MDWLTPDTAYGAAAVLLVGVAALWREYQAERRRSEKRDERYDAMRETLREGMGGIREVLAALKERVQ